MVTHGDDDGGGYLNDGGAAIHHQQKQKHHHGDLPSSTMPAARSATGEVQHDSVRYSRGEGVHRATHLGLGVFRSSATSAVPFGIGYTAATVDEQEERSRR